LGIRGAAATSGKRENEGERKCVVRVPERGRGMKRQGEGGRENESGGISTKEIEREHKRLRKNERDMDRESDGERKE
jgi:hypothetical protein